MSVNVNHSTFLYTRATPKHNSIISLPQGKKGKRTPIKYVNLCESCGATLRLIAFKTPAGKRYICRDCAGVI